MDISRSCKVQNLNWALIPDLVERIRKIGIKVEIIELTLDWYPDELQFDSIDDGLAEIKKRGAPRCFRIYMHARSGGTFTLTRDFKISGREFMSLSLSEINDSIHMDSLIEFLGLSPDESPVLPPHPPRTAFIAHRFDALGDATASKLARFLELLGFRVQTGRGYAPGSVAEKVKARIEEQSILFVLLTPGSDPTWLVQESILGSIRGKPIFVLKEQGAEFKPGLLADHEYIPFEASSFEAVFTPVLEGLRGLGYLAFKKA